MSFGDNAKGAEDLSFKSRFYEFYASTHTLHRKVYPSAEAFKEKAPAWDRRLGTLLPPDKGARIIDVGCGTGSLVWWLQARGFHGAEGIDLSPEQVALAKAAGVRNVAVSDLRLWLAARPRAYDLIFLRDVIEHFTRAETLELLDLVCSALRTKGKAVIQVPNAESPLFGRVRYGDYTHEMAFTRTSIAQLFNVVGLRIDRCVTVPPILLGRRSVHRYVLWKTVEYFYKTLVYAEGGHWPPVVSQNIIIVGSLKSSCDSRRLPSS